MKKIITVSLMLLSVFSLQSQAMSLTVNDTMEGTIGLLSTSAGTIQDGVSVASILWKYEIALNDSDDASQKALMVQRSTKAEYLVDCAKQTIALSKWQMFSDADGLGKVIWADQTTDNVDYYQPERKAERSLISVACEVKTAQQ
jgi:hypothetical protein